MKTFVIAVFVFFSSFVGALRADVAVNMTQGQSPARPKHYLAPPLRMDKTPPVELLSLERLPAYEIDDVKQRNAGAGPLRNGVVRIVSNPIAVSTVAATGVATLNWRGIVKVAGAHAVRLHLTSVLAAADTTFWVYGEGDEPFGFDTSLVYDGSLWTPTVFGDSIVLEVESNKPVAFKISAVNDIRSDDEIVAKSTECFRDLACYASDKNIVDSATAVASYTFVRDGNSYVCSGGLIIDRAETFAPYFLTARHCISTASEAASLEAYWDYRASSCNAIPPPLSSRPRTNGSTLLVSSAPTDVSLLRLSSVPGTRYWLGWSAAAVNGGISLHRISNPFGGPQVYSSSVTEAQAQACSNSQRPYFIYQFQTVGATAGGSSGSPVLRDAGVIVGQLKGACGPDPENPCNYANRDLDGAMSESYAVLKPYIDPSPAGSCGACTADAKTACLLNNRFKVAIRWRNAFANPATSGTGDVIRYTENRPEVHPTLGPLSETAFFSFFAPGRLEVAVKMLSGVGINDKFWVFAAGFANNEYWIDITDTKTCQSFQRFNEHGKFSNITDFEAFPFP